MGALGGWCGRGRLMLAHSFEYLFEEVLRMDGIRARIERLAPDGTAERESLMRSLRLSVLGSDGLMYGNWIDGKTEGTPLESVRSLLREYMSERDAEYREASDLLKQAVEREHRTRREAEKFRQRSELAGMKEKYGGRDVRRSGLGRIAAGMRLRKSPAEQREEDYLMRLETARRYQAEAAELAVLRRRAERQLIPRLLQERDFQVRLGALLSEIGPSLRDEVMLPHVLEWLERKIPQSVDARTEGDEKEEPTEVQPGLHGLLADETVRHDPVENLDGFDVPPPREERPMADRRTVFLVHGRWTQAVDAMCDFLRALDLDVRRWPEVRLTGREGQHNADVLDNAFRTCDAVVVFMTPDDVAALHPSLGDPHDETLRLEGQARPNVLFEAGYAWRAIRERTLLVEYGSDLRRLSDLSGVDRVKFDGSADVRGEVADRLKSIGLAVRTTGGAYLSAGRFPDALPPLTVGDPGQGPASDLLRGVPLHWVLLATLGGGREVNVTMTAANTGTRVEQVSRTLSWLMREGLAEPVDGHTRAQAATTGACRLTSAGLERLRAEVRRSAG